MSSAFECTTTFRCGSGFIRVVEVMKGMRILKRTQPWIGTVMPENVASLFEDVLGLYSMGVNQFIIGHATGVKWSKEVATAYQYPSMERYHPVQRSCP